ncbi:hypothetical protein AB6A40_001076 [Gnathostoma spinigerum]|uniref:Coiled-coil domain-containing protein 25 n=1 Tax=Gnathostoma spinigerum TaxID=75299 RepID=A0ABD6E5H2_9BILA
MVIKFTSTAIDPPVLLYMGVDKFENEKLIRWGWPEDVWFHVDKLSSAHVYVRLPPHITFDTMPESLMIDCAQLVKANSIQGCKMNNIEVVFTPWENLKKTGDMDVGQIGFKDDKRVRKIKVEKKNNDILNRLNKTKVTEDIDYQAEREQRDAKERQKQRQKQKEMKEIEKLDKEAKERENRIRSYEDVFTEENLREANERGNDSDDFICFIEPSFIQQSLLLISLLCCELLAIFKQYYFILSS